MSSNHTLTRRRPPSALALFDIALAKSERAALLRRLKRLKHGRPESDDDCDKPDHRDRQASRIRQSIETIDGRIHALTLERIGRARSTRGAHP